MQIYAIYMQKYANICSTVCATEICKNMQKYAKYMHAICKNMQNMQSRFLYAEYAKICTPHFADELQVPKTFKNGAWTMAGGLISTELRRPIDSDIILSLPVR
jgi:uncharacterized membrane protein